jgi:4-diphosphocytidyl-2-C-methyl-D-erythritol kinase
LDQDDLLKLAAQLGSDVPFFIVRSAAVCCGRGEIVRPISVAPSFHLLLLKPDFGVLTSSAYSRWKDSRQLPGVDYLAQEFAGIRFMNDLERPVFEKFVLLAHLKTWLHGQPEVGAALMSGSGSTMFAVLREGADANQLSAKVRTEIDPTIWTFVCETVDRALRRSMANNRGEAA